MRLRSLSSSGISFPDVCCTWSFGVFTDRFNVDELFLRFLFRDSKTAVLASESDPLDPFLSRERRSAFSNRDALSFLGIPFTVFFVGDSVLPSSVSRL